LWFDTSTGVLFYYLNDEDNTQQWVVVSAGSGDFETLTTLNSSSANWTSTFTTVTANSASWDAHTDPYDDTPVTTLQSASAEWDGTSSVVQTNSATSWDNTANTLNSITTNGATTLNNISVGTITTLHPTAAANDNAATGLQSASIGGRRNTASGVRATTFGGRENTVSGQDSTTVGGNNQKVIGIESEGIGSTNLKLFSKYTSAVGAANSTIGTLSGVDPNPEALYADESFAKHSIILGGENIEIQHAQHAATVGGEANTVETNHHRSVILGGTGITTDAEDTAYVSNLNIKAGFKMPTGAATDYVLTTNASGVGTWQENQTAVTDLAGTYSTSEAAEAVMTNEGFYTWTSSDGDDYRALAFKDSNKVWHLREYINNNRTFIVGDQPGDDFTNPYDANRYLAHCDLGNDGISVIVSIRAGVYQIPFSLRGHPQGDRIFYKPIAGDEPTYPVLEDFSTIASPSRANDLAMLRGKYPVQIEMSTDTNALIAVTNSLIFKDCLIISTNVAPTKEGVMAHESGHADVEGCTFFGWEDGAWSVGGSDVRVTNCTSAWCLVNGFISQTSSHMRAGGRVMVAHSGGMGIQVSENAHASISDIQILAVQKRAVEVRHQSSLGENGTITYNISGCNLSNTESGAIHARRNSYIKISSAVITGHTNNAIGCDANSYIYLTDTPYIDPASGNTDSDIKIDERGHIEVAVANEAAFVSDYTITIGQKVVTPVPPPVGQNSSNRVADEGAYGSIIIS